MSKILVLRTIYLEPAVDEKLRWEAIEKRISKNDLFQYYLELGMKEADRLRQKEVKKNKAKTKSKKDL